MNAYFFHIYDTAELFCLTCIHVHFKSSIVYFDICDKGYKIALKGESQNHFSVINFVQYTCINSCFVPMIPMSFYISN